MKLRSICESKNDALEIIKRHLGKVLIKGSFDDHIWVNSESPPTKALGQELTKIGWDLIGSEELTNPYHSGGPKKYYSLRIVITDTKSFQTTGFAFHITPTENLSSIKTKGLRPNEKGRIYLFLDKQAVNNLLGHFIDPHMPSAVGSPHHPCMCGNCSMLEVDIDGLNLYPDPEIGPDWNVGYTRETIEHNKIKILLQDVRDWPGYEYLKA
jgi:hypothetical protein